jgi:hypothetical protein
MAPSWKPFTVPVTYSTSPGSTANAAVQVDNTAKSNTAETNLCMDFVPSQGENKVEGRRRDARL